MKIRPIYLLLLCAYACTNSPTVQTPPAAVPPTIAHRLNQTEIDSLLNLQFSTSLLQRFYTTAVPDTVPIHRLSGQLDFDPEPEHVLWYQFETYGHAVVLDHQADGWIYAEPIMLDFMRGVHPPQLDSSAHALLVYSYGSGSSYSSEVISMHRLTNDSLVCVFQMLESEYSSLLPFCGAYKHISGQYTFKNKELIVADYLYQVWENDENGDSGRRLLRSNIRIPFRWSAAQQVYLPELPEGFPQEEPILYISDGETSFDPYIEPKLERLKRHGPKWVRKALCNQDEVD
ncbi:MAG: hypothetical protein JNJ57_04585 [Saprospiraceae bacterium]|nr:hypothetical protein [Saprospiraceae bacterium]